MIFIGPHVFEVIEGPIKILKLKCADPEEMGPYRTDPTAPKGFRLSPAIFSAYRDTVLQDLLYITKKIYNEDYFMADKTLESLESLAKQYEFGPVVAWFERYWLQIDKLSQEAGLYTEAKNRPHVVHDNNKLISALKDELELSDIGQELRDARISYLEGQNATLMSQIEYLEASFAKMEDHDTEEWLIEISKDLSGYEKLTGKYRSNKVTISYLQGTYDDKKTVVTDDMIAEAKKVPFDKLIKMERIGGRMRALCPFHNEKTASFYVYPDTNRGFCHGCGRSADTIQYLVEIKKMEFNQAVLMLLNY